MTSDTGRQFSAIAIDKARSFVVSVDQVSGDVCRQPFPMSLSACNAIFTLSAGYSDVNGASIHPSGMYALFVSVVVVARRDCKPLTCVFGAGELLP